MPNIIKNNVIEEVLAPIAAASSTDSNSDRLDMSGYEGVVFITPITDSAATGVATMTIEQNTADSDTSMAALSGASATATSVANDDLNNTLLMVEVVKPLERYLQAVLTSATANIAYGTTIAIRYGAKERPITEAASVQASTIVYGPAEA